MQTSSMRVTCGQNRRRRDAHAESIAQTILPTLKLNSLVWQAHIILGERRGGGLGSKQIIEFGEL